MGKRCLLCKHKDLRWIPAHTGKLMCTSLALPRNEAIGSLGFVGCHTSSRISEIFCLKEIRKRRVIQQT